MPNVIIANHYSRIYNLKNYKNLYAYVEENYKPHVKNVLMIDEVQLCPQFEIAINSLHNSKKYNIYVTGSNAFLLSSDLSTLFSGRFIEIPVFPFSFKEYTEYFDINDNFSYHLEDYLKVGGLAGSYLYENKEDASQYIKDVYTSLIKRDLVDRYNIEDVALLDNITEFLMDNIANLTTVNNISNVLNREIEPLLAVKDAYPKIILANTGHPLFIKDGVKIYDLARWLMGEEN